MNSPPLDLDWTMTQFAGRVAGVDHAIVVVDGMLLGCSRDLPRDRADAAAAITSGLVGMSTRSAALLQGGNVVQTLVEMRGGLLFLMSSGEGSAVVAWANSSCDVGLVGYELAVLADQVRAAAMRGRSWPLDSI